MEKNESSSVVDTTAMRGRQSHLVEISTSEMRAQNFFFLYVFVPFLFAVLIALCALAGHTVFRRRRHSSASPEKWNVFGNDDEDEFINVRFRPQREEKMMRKEKETIPVVLLHEPVKEEKT